MLKAHSLFRGLVFSVVALAVSALAQTPKQIPPPGIELSQNDRAELTNGARALRREIDALTQELATQPRLRERVPDVEIFHKAVDWALRYNEFFSPKEVDFARKLLREGHERAGQLRLHQTPWLEATGLVVRGYRSKLDGSIQPYGLVVPEKARTSNNRLMVWLLGRGEKRTELAFLQERKGGPPQLTPASTLTLVPYGRFCNATKFAGEVDVFEALDEVRRDYKVDEQRIMVGGFSMGGGSAWHLATHYSGLWSAAAPGAGFAETAVFTKALAPGKEPRPWWEQKLWAWYDATNYAANLFNVPTVAYSGEIDGQKQAADIMTTALEGEGLKLEHHIGPQTGHKYHPETQKTLTARIEQLLDKGRDKTPREVHLTTYTLRYPESAWVRIEGLQEHWQRADVKARLNDDNVITAETKNVTSLAFKDVRASAVVLDGQRFTFRFNEPPRFARRNGTWRRVNGFSGLTKRPGLTGPIDDAFMESFVFVRPTGQPLNATVGNWVNGEIAYATKLWRDVFRGDVLIKNDTALTQSDIQNKNLILWGDPSSNAVLGRIIKRLPLQWNKERLMFRGQNYDAAHHAPILIFPNPLNPQRYVVLNSGIDFRADGYGNNALQTPKLPDWALVDLREAPGARWPGKIVEAGFFNESWQ